MLIVQSISLYFQLFLFLCATLLPLLRSQKFIVLAFAISSASNVNDSTDGHSLLAFKLMVEDDPLGALHSWNDSLHFCKWEGITCGRRHQRVTILDLTSKSLVGSLSPTLGNLTFLRQLYLENNTFHGKIPEEIGRLIRLQRLFLGSNSLDGDIPRNLSRCSNLINLRLSQNKLVGIFPMQILSIYGLKRLGFDDNNIIGAIPSAIANLTSLEILSIRSNILFGEIPSGLGNLVSLNILRLEGNDFQGNLPNEIGKLQNLRVFGVAWNILTGEIPETLGNLTRLIVLDLQNNKFHGAIPASIGNCTQLTALSFRNNNLSGVISKQVFTLTRLGRVLDLSQNKLNGELPYGIGNLKTLTTLNLSYNDFSGTLPNELGSCISLEYLAMQGNNFHGLIPSSFSSLQGIRVLDVSSNNLSGQIPDYFSKFSMSLLNLSFNNFDGKVPIAGVFSNASSVSLLGNAKLCGGAAFLNLPICLNEARRMPQLTHKLKIIISVCTSMFGLVSLSFLLIFFVGKKMRRKPKESQLISKPSLFMEVSYGDLLRATNNFSFDNLIGKGYFSSVYKGVIEQVDQTIAIKVLNLQLRGAVKSFKDECKALRTIRHRNLLKTITSCSTIDFKGNDFKAIVYEFMPKGSLDSWLHGGNQDLEEGRCMDLLQRVNIAIDVSVALDYLHNHCHIPVVHCDLKPSNILLDESMTAHVGDFGLAKLITNHTKVSKYSSIGIRGTIGYVAPEYGQGSCVSAKGDIYSYGVLLLEMITGKRPTDMMFVGGLNLHSYVDMALSSQVLNIVDSVLLSFITTIDHKTVNCLVSLLKLGLACSMESPSDRMDIENVITELHMIKTTLLSMDHES